MFLRDDPDDNADGHLDRPEDDPRLDPIVSCAECGHDVPVVRLYCGRPPEKGFRADPDGDCSARLCSDACAKAHAEKHVEKGAEWAARLDARMRRRIARTGAKLG